MQNVFCNANHSLPVTANRPKRLYLSPGTGHGLAFWTHPQEYDEQLQEFLKENGLD